MGIKLSELLGEDPRLPYAMAIRELAAAMKVHPSTVITNLQGPLADVYTNNNNYRYPFGSGRETERFSASLFNLAHLGQPPFTRSGITRVRVGIYYTDLLVDSLVYHLDFEEIVEKYKEFIRSTDDHPYSPDLIRAAFAMIELDVAAAFERPLFETDEPIAGGASGPQDGPAQYAISASQAGRSVDPDWDGTTGFRFATGIIVPGGEDASRLGPFHFRDRNGLVGRSPDARVRNFEMFTLAIKREGETLQAMAKLHPVRMEQLRAAGQAEEEVYRISRVIDSIVQNVIRLLGEAERARLEKSQIKEIRSLADEVFARARAWPDLPPASPSSAPAAPAPSAPPTPSAPPAPATPAPSGSGAASAASAYEITRAPDTEWQGEDWETIGDGDDVEYETGEDPSLADIGAAIFAGESAGMGVALL